MSIVRDIAEKTEQQIKTVQTMTRRSWLASLGAAGMVKDTTEETFNKLVRRGETVAEGTRTELERLNKRLRREQRKLNEDVQDAEQTVERRLTEVLASFNVPTRRDLQVLDARIAQLNAQLRDLNAGENTYGVPVHNYENLNVEEVNALLPTLVLNDLYAVEQYEAANQRRVTILREVDRQITQRLSENGEVTAPFADYNELRAEDVIERLEELTVEQLRHVKAYESTHAKRVTVLREADRRIEAAWNETVAA
jgi:poly(hydroxyalkanoate) granule-associated protein